MSNAYFEAAVMQIEIRECLLSFSALFPSSFLSKNIRVKIYRTIIVRVVLYGCETWSLTLTKECRMRVFENRVLRRIFGLKRDDVKVEWRKLHSEELNYLHCSTNIVRVIELRNMK